MPDRLDPHTLRVALQVVNRVAWSLDAEPESIGRIRVQLMSLIDAEPPETGHTAEEYDAILARLSQLLTDTATALKGPPAPLMLHDWSDLPTVAAALKAERGRDEG